MSAVYTLVIGKEVVSDMLISCCVSQVCSVKIPTVSSPNLQATIQQNCGDFVILSESDYNLQTADIKKKDLMNVNKI